LFRTIQRNVAMMHDVAGWFWLGLCRSKNFKRPQ
jgi:hypothetical protein